MSEDALVRQVMTAVIDALPPDTVDLDGAIRRGRALRARVRLRRGLGAVAATAVLVAGGSLALRSSSADPLAGYARPASVPAYTGPSSLPLAQWQQAIAGLLPGTVVASYPVERLGDNDFSAVSTAFRVRRDGRTSIVRVNVWTAGGGSNGHCDLGMKDCSEVVRSVDVPGAFVQTFALEQTHAHEDGQAASILRGMHRLPQVGAAPDDQRATIELQITAVAGDLGPGADGWTVGMVVPASVGLSRAELLALVQTVPLPAEAVTAAGSGR